MPMSGWPLLYIEWLDHCSRKDGSWADPDELARELKPIVVSSVGWLIKETDHYLLLVSSNAGGDNVGGDCLILKNCISRRRVLKTPWVRKRK